MNRTNGIILLIGSLLFWVAAFMPVSQGFFVLGAAVACIGMGMLAYRLNAMKGSIYPLIAVAAAGIGLVLWMPELIP